MAKTWVTFRPVGPREREWNHTNGFIRAIDVALEEMLATQETDNSRRDCTRRRYRKST